jgi:hypothetical protein
MVTPSEITLRGGNFMVRSEGLNLRSNSSSSSGAPRRAVLLSNQPEASAEDVAGARQATISFQLNNQSHERVTVSQVELVLLGVVTVFEDQIAHPQPPAVEYSLEPKDLVVEESDPRVKQDYVSLPDLFKDQNDPPGKLRFSAQVEPAGAVGASLDANQKLDLTFGKYSDEAKVTLTATDAFDQSAAVQFQVTVKGPPDPSAPLVASLSTIDYFPRLINVGQPAPGGGIEAFVVEEKRQDLGDVRLNYALDRDDLIAPASSGNLLPEEESSVLRANSARSVVIRVGCRTTLKLPELPKDLMQGEGSRRLSAYRPQPVALIYLLAVRVRINSEDGTRGDLYSENLYVLHSHPYDMAQGAELSPEQAAAQLLNLAVSTNGETMAFERGQLCRLSLARADEVSEFCFYRNPQHPLRKTAVVSGSPDPWARTNLVAVLAGIESEHPAIWKPIAASLNSPAADDPMLRAKRDYVERKLAERPRKIQLEATSVQVVK